MLYSSIMKISNFTVNRDHGYKTKVNKDDCLCLQVFW